MAKVTFSGSRGKQSGGRVKYRWLDEALNATPKPQRTSQRPADPRAPVSWQRNNTRAGMGRDAKDDLTWFKQNQEQNVQDRLQANEYAAARYSALLRERFLSNIMGPRRNNYDVGINEISTLDAYNRMWGSSSVTEQERILRQNAAPPGMMWTPYGYQGKTAYVPIGMSNPGETSYGPGSPYYSGNTGGGGGGYGYNDWGTGGGGGGGGTTNKNSLFSDLMTWKIK